MNQQGSDPRQQRRRDFGSYLKGLRNHNGLTLKKVAVDIEITAPYLSMIETGKRGAPDNLLKSLANEYNVTLEQLIVERAWPQLPLLAEIVNPTKDLSTLVKGLLPAEVEEVKCYIALLRLRKGALG